MREPAPKPTGQPQARLRRRFEQQNIGLCAFDPLARADRSVTEPQEQELEQRPRRRIWINDEDGRHEKNFGRR